MTGKIEQRFATGIRAETRGSTRRLVGYAARYGVVADIGHFRERIAPDAFAASIGEGGDILALLDHDPTRVLGRTRSKTLQLRAVRRRVVMHWRWPSAATWAAPA